MTQPARPPGAPKLTDRIERLLLGGGRTASDIARTVDRSERQVRAAIRSLIDAGVVERIGKTHEGLSARQRNFYALSAIRRRELTRDWP